MNCVSRKDRTTIQTYLLASITAGEGEEGRFEVLLVSLNIKFAVLETWTLWIAGLTERATVSEEGAILSKDVDFTCGICTGFVFC
jgi:hypothetical protein